MTAESRSRFTEEGVPSGRVVLVTNALSGHERGAHDAIAEHMSRAGLHIVDTIPIDELDRLPSWLKAEPVPLIVAGGGDGTIGSVANLIAGTPAVVGVLPLGTSNDIARSLRIPTDLERAIRVLTEGKVATVDVGKFIADGAEPRVFVHAAAMGISTTFARLATEGSFRKRLGPFTYLMAGAVAVRRLKAFRCELRVEEKTVVCRLLHLSVINAPIFGGFFGFQIPGSGIDDRRLDVLAIEDMSLLRLVVASIPVLVGKPPWSDKIHVYHGRDIGVMVDQPIDVTLDGEPSGTLPGRFALEAESLRVMAPEEFVDVDDESSPSPEGDDS